MLYFRATVLASDYAGENAEYFEQCAHAVVLGNDVTTSAAFVANVLEREGWTIVDFLTARPVKTAESLCEDPCLVQLINEASSSGFSYFLECTPPPH